MSNVPLPEPHHQSAANFNAPDEPFYTADQMHAHAAAVSAAKDKEIAALRERVAALDDDREAMYKALVDLDELHTKAAEITLAAIRPQGSAPKSHDTEDDFDATIDAVLKQKP